MMITSIQKIIFGLMLFSLTSLCAMDDRGTRVALMTDGDRRRGHSHRPYAADTIVELVEASDPSPLTIFAMAAQGLNEQLRPLLNTNPRIVETRNRQSKTILIVAAKHGQSKIVDLILAYNPNIIVDLILAYNPNINALDQKGRSALMHAALNQTTDPGVIPLLLAHRCKETKDNIKLDICDKNGQTALMHAVATSKEAAVTALLAAGASKELFDKNGKSVYDLAREHGNEKICALLGMTRCCSIM